ncbi:MAG: DMT family transporter [Hyphomicrobiaceae bacterium]|nr:DMT family transporter [Hyphomicrobiaceae bacterium]
MPLESPPDLARDTTDPSTKRASDLTRAILLMLVAITLFSCLDTAAKYLAGHAGLPVGQVIWLRFVVQFVLLLTLVPALGLLSTRDLFTTTRPGWQAIRSVMMALTTAMNFLALKWLRLDQTIAITFLSPLIVALLAGPFLGEWVGWRRLVAILVGFIGILVVVRPGFGDIHPAVAFSFAGVLAYAAFTLITRHIASADPPLVTLFYSMFAGVVIGAPVALIDWAWPTSALDWGLLLSLGILGGAGHYLFILAYRLAPAGIITPYIYFQIVTMVGLGYLVFGDVPDAFTLIGAGIVIASGIYLWHRERLLKSGA